jgi:hypothetical protein
MRRLIGLDGENEDDVMELVREVSAKLEGSISIVELVSNVVHSRPLAKECGELVKLAVGNLC